MPEGVDWGAYAIGPDGEVLLEHEPDRVLSIASVGKLCLLFAAARAIDEGELDPAEPLRRTPADEVGDSGLWQDLGVDALPAADVAALVGAHSDNLATNVLLRRLGPVPPIGRIELHDRVRDVRRAGDPPRLATGTARDLAELFAAPLPPLVAGWLSRNADLSMVPGDLGLDPLAHVGRLRNKTGTDAGVRADAGALETTGGRVAYAVLVNWSVASDHRQKGSDPSCRVNEAMRSVGRALNESSRLSGDSS
jgi:beta-lactamase class A